MQASGRAWSFCGWGTGALAAAVGVWSAAPALTPFLAIVAILSSELGAWVAFLGLCSAVCTAIAWQRRGRRGFSWALAPALAAVTLGAGPPWAIDRLARAEGLSLPLSALLGLQLERGRVEPQTVTYLDAGGATLQLDVYRPAPAARAPRTLVVIHGGSWRGGERSEVPAANQWWVRHGFTVFDIDYRLAPAPNFELAAGDVRCALRWVHANAPRFGGAGDGLVLLGRSAGAHLALLAGYGSGDSRLPASCGGPEPTIAAVIAYYPPTDLSWDYDHLANPRVIDGPATLRRLMGGAPAALPRAYVLASPTEHVSAAAPPTLIFQGLSDQYVRPENATLLSRRLASAGVRHRAVMIPWAQHGFDFLYLGPSAALAREEIARFLALPEL